MSVKLNGALKPQGVKIAVPPGPITLTAGTKLSFYVGYINEFQPPGGSISENPINGITFEDIYTYSSSAMFLMRATGNVAQSAFSQISITGDFSTGTATHVYETASANTYQYNSFDNWSKWEWLGLSSSKFFIDGNVYTIEIT